MGKQNQHENRSGTLLFLFGLMAKWKELLLLFLVLCENMWLWKIPKLEKWPLAKERQLIRFKHLFGHRSLIDLKKNERKTQKDKTKMIWNKQTEGGGGLYNYIHKTKQLIVLKICVLNHVICDGGGTVFVPFFSPFLVVVFLPNSFHYVY